MKMLIPALAIVAAAVVFFACKGGKASLPKAMPADFELRYWQDGGMLPQGLNYSIRKDSVKVESWMDQMNNTWQFPTDSTEMAQLWSVLRENHASSIRTYEEMVYDRGGDGFAFTADGKNIEVSNSGLNFVDKKWSQHYRAIVDKIHQMVLRGLEPFHRDFEIAISGEVPANMDRFYVSFREKTILEWDSASGKAFPLGTHAFRELSGKHILQVTTQYQGKYKSAELPVELQSGLPNRWSVAWQGDDIMISEAQ